MILSVQIEFLGKLQGLIMLMFPPFLQQKKKGLIQREGKPYQFIATKVGIACCRYNTSKLHLPHPVLPSLLHYEPTYANENFALADTSSPCSQLCYFPYTRLPHALQHDRRCNVSLPLNASVGETKRTKKVPATSNMPTQNPSRIAQGKLDNPIKLKF
jgi:hypothetical protein